MIGRSSTAVFLINNDGMDSYDGFNLGALDAGINEILIMHTESFNEFNLVFDHLDRV
jgi:hypothetical protein